MKMLYNFAKMLGREVPHKIAVIGTSTRALSLARRIARTIQPALEDSGIEVVVYDKPFLVPIKTPKEVERYGADVRIYVDISEASK